MKGMSEPGPVMGASRYSHLVSTAPWTSVSRSKFAEVPPWAMPTVVRLPGWLEALKLPAPLVKSNSTAHTPLTLPTSPVIVNTPRSREYQPCLWLPAAASGWAGGPPLLFVARPEYTEVAKSTRPLIVTFGAGPCAKLGGASIPRAARTARTTTIGFLIAVSSLWRSRLDKGVGQQFPERSWLSSMR